MTRRRAMPVRRPGATARRTATAAAAVVVALCVLPSATARAQASYDRVVIFGLPAVTWDLVRDVDTPAIDALVARSAIAAMSTRTASSRPNTERGYLTIGAGNRAYVSGLDPHSHLAYPADAPLEGGTAAHALERRVGRAREGAIVHIGVPYLADRQDTRLYGAEIGALGEALARAGVPRAVVSAADVSIDAATTDDMRRPATLAIVDRTGTIDAGALEGLLVEDPRAPFGVATDRVAFRTAVASALEDARVVVLDPGETSRADEFFRLSTPQAGARMRRAALERADTILGDVVDLLDERDLLIVVAPSGPTHLTDSHLTPFMISGSGFPAGWARSPTTHRSGMVTISDVAPTVLAAMALDAPGSMDGTAITWTDRTDADPVPGLVELNEASLFREDFASSVFYVLAGGLFSVVALLAFVVFLGVSERPLPVLVAVAYLTLAVPLAAHVVRALEFWRLGMPLAHVTLWLVAAGLAALAWMLPGPRWAGGVALMLGSALAFASDAAFGGPWQVNGVFGHSPVVAGRFYGLSNPGHAILYTAAMLGLAGLVELLAARREGSGRLGAPGEHLRAPRWFGALLVAAVLLVGLPTFGANFGGLIEGVAAVAVAYTLARGRRIRLRWLLVVGAVAVAAAGALTLYDLTRPATSQTHLGRFVSDITEGGLPTLATIVLRKATSAFGTLRLAVWTYVVPLALAVLTVLLWRPTGVLRDVLPGHPVIRAALWGSVVAGVVGFLVNDSGIAIPALVLAHVVPFLVLMAADVVLPPPELRVPQPRDTEPSPVGGAA